jgi:hypothetical protein
MSRFLESLREFLWLLSGAATLPVGVGAAGCLDPGAGLAVFNFGGPRSRGRRETIKASLFPGNGDVGCDLGVLQVGEVWALFKEAPSLRDAAWEILVREGFNEPEEAFAQLEAIPRARLHCRAVFSPGGSEGAVRDRETPLDFLRKALVLGKCRGDVYDPDGPLIWTENRLGRRLELYEIRESFYD